MLSLDAFEAKSLQFEVQIQGIQPDQLKGHLRFVIDEIEYGFPAEIETGVISVDIPPVSKIVKRTLKDGEVVQGKLEVHGNGFHLIPWSGEFEIDSHIQVEAKLVGSKTKVTEKKEVKKEDIKVKSVREKKPAKEQEIVPDEFEEDEEDMTNKQKYFDKVSTNEDTPIVEKQAKNHKKSVNELVKSKLEKMTQLVDTKLIEPKKKKVVREEKEILSKDPPQINSVKDIKKYMSMNGLKNNRVQDSILESAKYLVGDDIPTLYEHVQKMLTQKHDYNLPLKKEE